MEPSQKPEDRNNGTSRGALREGTTLGGLPDNRDGRDGRDHRRALPNPAYARILADCRDLIAHRLLVSLTSMMDRLADGLLDRANRTNVLSESTLMLESRSVLQSNRAFIVSAFEKALRARIDRRLKGEPEPKDAPKSVDTLQLVDDAQVEEDIAVKNFRQSLSNRCEEQLLPLNARIGLLLGERQLATEDNPLGPHAIGSAFREAWEKVDIRPEGKIAILRMMDAGMIGDVNAIYADINRHLANLNVLPNLSARASPRPEGSSGTAGQHAAARAARADAAPGSPVAQAYQALQEAGGDVFASLRELLSRAQRAVPRSGTAVSPMPDPGMGAAGAMGAMGAAATGAGGAMADSPLAAFMPLLMRATGRPQLPGGGFGAPLAGVPGGSAGAALMAAPGAGGIPVGSGVGTTMAMPGTMGGPAAGGFPAAAGIPAGGGAFDASSLLLPDLELAGGGQVGIPTVVDPGAMIASLTRMQQTYGRAADSATGAMVAADGATIVPFDPFLLRRLGPADLGSQIDSTGAVTIELVAMLFDFVSAEDHVPDAIKNLLYRLQIPVLKAALLDRDFFTRRSHPARLLVNRYAEASIAWTPEQGVDDPLYRKIRDGIETIQTEFTDRIDLFADVLADFEAFVNRQEEREEKAVQRSADEIDRGERKEVAGIVADAEIDRRVNAAQPPAFLDGFLRNQWRQVMVHAYQEAGEEGAAWRAVMVEMDNLLWSVQPKWKVKDRKDLVTRLPEMLSRLRTRLSDIEWEINAREKFMSELVECHARAVTATMERDAARPAPAHAAPLAAAEPAADIAAPEAADGPPRDQYHELAESLTRGNWIEFTEESGMLVFAKLSWVSPLRGKYLFTHRNGTKAFSLTREELAQRFRDDTARPVETEPLLDRAFSDVLSRLSTQAGV